MSSSSRPFPSKELLCNTMQFALGYYRSQHIYKIFENALSAEMWTPPSWSCSLWCTPAGPPVLGTSSASFPISPTANSAKWGREAPSSRSFLPLWCVKQVRLSRKIACEFNGRANVVLLICFVWSRSDSPHYYGFASEGNPGFLQHSSGQSSRFAIPATVHSGRSRSLWDPICMNLSGELLYYVLQKKVSHTCLKWQVIIEFSFIGRTVSLLFIYLLFMVSCT